MFAIQKCASYEEAYAAAEASANARLLYLEYPCKRPSCSNTIMCTGADLVMAHTNRTVCSVCWMKSKLHLE